MSAGDRWDVVACPHCGNDCDVVETKKGTGTIFCGACRYRGFWNVTRDQYEATRSEPTTTTEPDHAENENDDDDDEAGTGRGDLLGFSSWRK